MWTPTTRQQHSRPFTRYQTDLTDAEWRVIAPHLPKPCTTGRPREWPMREIVNGIFYVMRAGCPWRLLPNDLPPWGSRAPGYFQQPEASPLATIHDDRARRAASCVPEELCG
jgi:transposase